MPIEKLEEFARDGQKNTDDLTLTDGFPVLLKPARQWFNWLFHSITSKINEVIDLDPIARSEIIDNLTTNDANKVASAGTVKELQDNKLDKTDLKDASTEQKGVVQVNNTLTSTSTTEALTAAQGKVLNDRFLNDFLNLKSENGYQKLPNGLIIQWGFSTGASSRTVTFPIAFPNECLNVSGNVYAGVGTFQTCSCRNATNQNFGIQTGDVNNVGQANPVKWTAIGY